MHFDCGGLSFTLPESITINGKLSIFAIAKFDSYALGGTNASGRQTILYWTGSNSYMFWQETTGSMGITVYDTGASLWKPATVDVGSVYNKIMAYYGYVDSSNEGIYVYDLEGNVVMQSSRSDIVTPQSITTSNYTIGSNSLNARKMCGTIYAVAAFYRTLSEDEIDELIKNFMDSDIYTSIDECILAVIFDRLKYGVTPYDIINGVYGSPVNSEFPPRWNLLTTGDVNVEVLG